MSHRSVLLQIIILISILLAISAEAQPVDQWETVFKEASKIKENAASPQDLEKLTGKLEQALAIAVKNQDPRQEALNLTELGEVFEALGRLSKAAECRENASAAWARVPDSRMQADALVSSGVLRVTLGEYTEAVRSLERALEIRKNLKDERGVAYVLNDLGNVYKDWALYPEATRFYAKSMEIARNMKDALLEALVLNNAGTVDMIQGLYSDAEKRFQTALAMTAQERNEATRELVLINLGHLARHMGDYAKASMYFSQALDLVRITKNAQSQCNLLMQLGELSADWGQSRRALTLYREALDVAKSRGDRKTETMALTRIGRLHAAKGKYEDALKDLLEARKVNEHAGLSSLETDAAIAGLYIDLHDTRKAEPFVKKVAADSLRGRLSLAKGEYANSAKYYASLLKTAEKTQNSDDLFTAYVGLAKAYEHRKDFALAEKCYTKALDITEELRSGLLPAERRSFLAVKINGFDRSEPARGLTRLKFKQNRPADGIAISELAKARAFSDKLMLNPERGYAGLPRDIEQKETDLVVELATLKKFRSCCPRDSDPERYDNFTKQIEKKQKELDLFVDMLWKEYTQYAALKYPRAITPESWAVRDTEHILIFDVLNEGVGVLLFKGKILEHSAYVPWKSEDLAQAIEKLREPFERVELGEFDPKLARNLYERLLGPVLAKIPQGSPLIIVPDGILAELPFETLVVDGTPEWKEASWGEYPVGLTYLADRHPISYYQSVNALTLQRSLQRTRPDRSEMLVLADPVFDMSDSRVPPDTSSAASSQDDLAVQVMEAVETETKGSLTFPRLQETEKLAQELKSLYSGTCDVYTGLDASKTVFLDKVSPKLNKYAYAVFATHGVYSTSIPWIMEPVLTMTMVPPGTDGFLRMTEVMSLDLHADAVVLAACQTALGEYVSGEGVMSMGRAFQYAGARSVIMTLWNVEEKAATALLSHFFRHVNEGKSKIEALSLARSDVRKQGYEHPFFWTPFILAGEPD